MASSQYHLRFHNLQTPVFFFSCSTYVMFTFLSARSSESVSYTAKWTFRGLFMKVQVGSKVGSGLAHWQFLFYDSKILKWDIFFSVAYSGSIVTWHPSSFSWHHSVTWSPFSNRPSHQMRALLGALAPEPSQAQKPGPSTHQPTCKLPPCSDDHLAGSLTQGQLEEWQEGSQNPTPLRHPLVAQIPSLCHQPASKQSLSNSSAIGQWKGSAQTDLNKGQIPKQKSKRRNLIQKQTWKKQTWKKQKNTNKTVQVQEKQQQKKQAFQDIGMHWFGQSHALLPFLTPLLEGFATPFCRCLIEEAHQIAKISPLLVCHCNDNEIRWWKHAGPNNKTQFDPLGKAWKLQRSKQDRPWNICVK